MKPIQDIDDGESRSESLVPSPSPPPKMDDDEIQKENSQNPCAEPMHVDPQDSAENVAGHDHDMHNAGQASPLVLAAAAAVEDGPLVPAIPAAPEPEIVRPPVEDYPDDTPLEALRPRAAAPREAPEDYPDDTPLEALRPRAAAPREAPAEHGPRAAPCEAPAERGPRAAPREAPAERGPRAAAACALVWTDVTCSSCNQVCGQFKFSPGPSRLGSPDPPTWFMRVKENDTWPSTGPNFRRRLAKVVGENSDYCKTWIQKNRKCCTA